MKKILSCLCIAALLLTLLAGCGHEHEWQEATCTSPRTCTVCGRTEGEPLGHKMSKPNYQSPATCSVCGYTEGEPLTADFVTHGIIVNLKEGGTADYSTTCKNDPAKTTQGKVSVAAYETMEPDDDHPEKESYEWKTVSLAVAFSDENAREYGANVSTSSEDYYTIDMRDTSSLYDPDADFDSFSVNYNGISYTECLCRMSIDWSGWEDGKDGARENVCTVRWEYRLPKGYDGAVVCLHDSALVWNTDQRIYDVYDPARFILFRMA